MNIWNRALSAWRNWRSGNERTPGTTPESHVLAAHRNIRELIGDTHIPAAVRAELSEEFDEVEAISRKLRSAEIHIAAFGRVGVGKSSLLNALLGREQFTTSPLHGETRDEGRADWTSLRDGNVVLLDTPGIDELDGEERARLAERVSRRADIVLMVCESDLVRSEFGALERLAATKMAVILVLNKSDRYTADEKDALIERLAQRCSGLIPPEHILPASARPAPETVIHEGPDGREMRSRRERDPDVAQLKSLLWSIVDARGESLAALNASLFTSELDEKIATRIVSARRAVAEKIIRKYCIAKGLLVAFNPVPVADLVAAAGTDVAMVVHLGEVYGFRLSRKEASRLWMTISAQFVALMGAYWGVNVAASALKGASAGLSTTLTAASQGALAWYATYLTGKMAQSWFGKGKSWGQDGPRETARKILSSIDRETLIRSARKDLDSRMEGQ